MRDPRSDPRVGDVVSLRKQGHDSVVYDRKYTVQSLRAPVVVPCSVMNRHFYGVKTDKGIFGLWQWRIDMVKATVLHVEPDEEE